MFNENSLIVKVKYVKTNANTLQNVFCRKTRGCKVVFKKIMAGKSRNTVFDVYFTVCSI